MWKTLLPDGPVRQGVTLVNHDSHSHYRDLREAITGYFFTHAGERSLTMRPDLIAKESIDAIAWIDAGDLRLEGYMLNEHAKPHFTFQVCALLGLDSANIRR